MNNFREIKDKILIKKTKQDKNGADYLILELENGERIFVFANYQLPSTKWAELKEGEEYNFTVKEGKFSTSVLTEFESSSDPLFINI